MKLGSASLNRMHSYRHQRYRIEEKHQKSQRALFWWYQQRLHIPQWSIIWYPRVHSRIPWMALGRQGVQHLRPSVFLSASRDNPHLLGKLNSLTHMKHLAVKVSLFTLSFKSYFNCFFWGCMRKQYSRKNLRSSIPQANIFTKGEIGWPHQGMTQTPRTEQKPAKDGYRGYFIVILPLQM